MSAYSKATMYLIYHSAFVANTEIYDKPDSVFLYALLILGDRNPQTQL